jgi:hypothetical protein
MNAMKHGAYSRQFAQIGALLAEDPAIRETLVALARKHNLKRQRANEVAALLFTRMFQRAEDAAGGRLNLQLPADDADSIEEAADRAAARQIRSALRGHAKKRNHPRLDQTPDTTGEEQS